MTKSNRCGRFRRPEPPMSADVTSHQPRYAGGVSTPVGYAAWLESWTSRKRMQALKSLA